MSGPSGTDMTQAKKKGLGSTKPRKGNLGAAKSGRYRVHGSSRSRVESGKYRRKPAGSKEQGRGRLSYKDGGQNKAQPFFKTY